MATRRKPHKSHTPLLVCRAQRRWSSSTSRTTPRPRWPSSSTSSIWSARCPHLHHHLLPRQHCLLHHLLLSSVAFHLHLLLLGRPRRCVRSLRARLSPSTAAAARDAPARSAARGCCKPSASASAAPTIPPSAPASPAHVCVFSFVSEQVRARRGRCGRRPHALRSSADRARAWQEEDPRRRHALAAPVRASTAPASTTITSTTPPPPLRAAVAASTATAVTAMPRAPVPCVQVRLPAGRTAARARRVPAPRRRRTRAHELLDGARGRPLRLRAALARPGAP